MLESGYWINEIFPKFKEKYPIDAGKIEKEQAGQRRPLPAGAFAKGVVEEIRAHPLVINPSTDFGIWEKPVSFLHNARGGVEYQTEMKAAGFTVSLDLNNPGNQPNYDPSVSSPWEETYIPKCNAIGLPWTYWHHSHTYAQIQSFLDKVKVHPLKTGGLNLESVVFEGLRPPLIADMIDQTLGTNAILSIPTLGWMDGIDWSALSRHVFHLEFFLNDPPQNGDWQGIPDVELARQLGEHARSCGARKIVFLCGVYPVSTSQNPYARTVTSAQYKSILAAAGERFGGIYLGDNNGQNYSQWT